MTRIKNNPIGLIVLAIALFATMFALICGTTYQCAYAAENVDVADGIDAVDQNPSTRGIYTSLSLSINGGNGKVWATVKNDVTIFPSTVLVIVELYSSETFQESYTNMTLESKVQIDDLNLGKTITAEASTGGVQKYWHARTRYKVDNGAWKEMKTGICLYAADGTFIRFE